MPCLPAWHQFEVMVWAQVVPCLAMYDTMKYIKSDVGTVAFGGAMGMSGFLLAVGTKVGSIVPVVHLFLL